MISYRNVSKNFGEGSGSVTALDNVTFSIDRGKLAVFLGPSGCGKTTLLRLTNRLITLNGGKIIVNKQDIMEWDPVKLRQSMGYAIQEIGLFPNKTVHGNIAVVPRLLGWKEDKITERVDELLHMLRLEPEKIRNRYPVELSGGQQQRIGVARCLAADPDIMLMDEPFGAIDPINREEIQNEFLRVQSKLKKTIAFVTHDIHEAIKMGDKIAVFQAGRLIQYDTPEVILTRPANSYIADFVGADRMLKVLGLLKARDAMSRECDNFIQISSETSHAMRLFDEKNCESLLVLNKSRPAGYLKKELVSGGSKEIKDILKPFARIIKEKDSLRDALSYMLISDSDYLPVVDSNEEFSGSINYGSIRKRILMIHKEWDEIKTAESLKTPDSHHGRN